MGNNFKFSTTHGTKKVEHKWYNTHCLLTPTVKKRNSCRKTCSLLGEWVASLLQLSRDKSAGERNPDSEKKALTFHHSKENWHVVGPRSPYPNNLNTLWPPWDEAEDDITPTCFLMARINLDFFPPSQRNHCCFPHCIWCSGKWALDQREKRGLKTYLCSGSLRRYFIGMLFFHASVTVLLSVKGQSVPLSFSCVIKDMIKKKKKVQIKSWWHHFFPPCDKTERLQARKKGKKQ